MAADTSRSGRCGQHTLTRLRLWIRVCCPQRSLERITSSYTGAMPRSSRGGTGSRIHSRAGRQMELRDKDGTREACSATCRSPASCVVVSGRLRESMNEQPAGRSRLVTEVESRPQPVGHCVFFSFDVHSQREPFGKVVQRFTAERRSVTAIAKIDVADRAGELETV